MRITDTMLMNNMLLSSMRNRQTLDKLQQQYHTLKKIQVPS
ncbi:MAG: flagellar hook-associated protein FlgL, partial [Epulopiscium sp.]|nr:flagellar hook-associated protein FlgL [Candidatus Epulonipiscium sp.]